MILIWTDYILPCVCACLACVGFSLVFNIHGMGKLICGVGGALGWLIYLLGGSTIFAAFLASAAIGVYSEVMARIRRCPVTGYLLVALLPLVLSLLCLPAWAGTVREEDFGVSEVERSAAEQGGTAEYGAALDDGLAELVDTGTRELAGIVRRAVRSSVLILLILLFCGLAETVQEGAGGSPSRSVSLAGTLAVTGM